MNIALTWDLFIISFFTIIVAYSFIVGKNHSIKIIIASYISILTADSIGNLFSQYLLPNIPSLSVMPASDVLVPFKILLFILVIVILAVKGGFFMEFTEGGGAIKRVFETLIFGFLNAGLIINTLLVYMSGGSFIGTNSTIDQNFNLYAESEIVRGMVNNAEIWFALPAIALVIISFAERRSGGSDI